MQAKAHPASRCYSLLPRRQTVSMMAEGPLILPFTSANETNPLWDVASAFRQCVTLDLNRAHFSNYKVVQHRDLEDMITTAPTVPYSLSPYYPATAPLEQDILQPEKRVMPSNMPELRTPTSRKHSKSLNLLSNFHTIRRLLSRLIRHRDSTIQTRELGKRVFMSLTAKVVLDSDSDESSSKASSQSPRTAKITLYSPDVFASLRNLFGISESSYRKSILESGPFISFKSNSKGASRTGGVFFFTCDEAYLVKTIKADEARTLIAMLPQYYRFMRNNGKRSLLTRFCGLYQVDFGTDEDPHPQILVVMNSVFPPHADQLLTERFDLKGSTTGREVDPDELEVKGARAVLKDLDLAREVQLVKSTRKGGNLESQQYGLNIGPSAKAALFSQLQRDVQLLVDCKVIDYSLLVGVCKLNDKHDDNIHLRSSMPRRSASTLLFPFQALLAPPISLCRAAQTIGKRGFCRPFSFFGSGDCVVDGGPLSHIHGKRTGSEAIYYFGLIDFLQPFNRKKLLEYHAKGLVYEKTAFSCIPPDAYAERFLTFLNEHIV